VRLSSRSIPPRGEGSRLKFVYNFELIHSTPWFTLPSRVRFNQRADHQPIRLSGDNSGLTPNTPMWKVSANADDQQVDATLAKARVSHADLELWSAPGADAGPVRVTSTGTKITP
jgi:hypothetical protein